MLAIMTSVLPSFSFLFFLVCHLQFMVESFPLVPAIYGFGDSLIDVGNNNYLNVYSQANFPHNGVDFPCQKPTGRFCNGKVFTDFLAEEVGLPMLPPYLSLVDESRRVTNVASLISGGTCFASGGAGILNETSQGYNINGQIQNNRKMLELNKNRPMSLSTQIDLYSSVYEYLVEELGYDAAQAHLSESLFLVVMGSNDLFVYYNTDVHVPKTPQQYVDSMISTFESQLKLLYKYGARKFVVNSVAILGCTPSIRMNMPGGECYDEMNYWAGKYNIALRSLLQRLEVELHGFAYSYVDTYGLTNDVIHNPSSHGFKEIKSACCGGGPLNAQIPCIPLAFLCQNRTDHLFWDMVHPTEASNRMIVDYIFYGSNYTYPINVKELIAKPTDNIGYRHY